jgi:hypothetical protein
MLENMNVGGAMTERGASKDPARAPFLLYAIALTAWLVCVFLSVTTFATNDYTQIVRVALGCAALHIASSIALMLRTKSRWRILFAALSLMLIPVIVDDVQRLIRGPSVSMTTRHSK